MNPPLDFIGDVHGHAAALSRLLAKLGYREGGGAWRHPDRRALFLGDLVDRGPEVRRTLELVRAMVEAGSAGCLMGNHEYNALAWASSDGAGGALRSHTPVHLAQHRKTLEDFSMPTEAHAGGGGAEAEGRRARWAKMLAWFRTLPLFLEGDGFCAVHAAWIPESLDLLQKLLAPRGVDDVFMRETHRTGSPAWRALEDCLKGPEAPLPGALALADKEGHLRRRARLKWWLPRERPVDPAGLYHVEEGQRAALGDIPPGLIPSLTRPSENAPPIFFGHYWMQGVPRLLSPRVACLDWSVAVGGRLCAYRWDGERDLREDRLVWVEA
ncbi:MAG: metallophosphoesterase [Spirochaetes bacterium]|nr:metallophosphoesterase [Spirochaetota bacterium]